MSTSTCLALPQQERYFSWKIDISPSRDETMIQCTSILGRFVLGEIIGPSILE